MTSPLRIEFDVDCSAAHAFTTWTSRIAAWWPPDHTVSGDPKAVVVLEPGVGGRIYERSPLGPEHEWGTITAWEPPWRLAYSWYLGRDRRTRPTSEIRFVTLEHDAPGSRSSTAAGRASARAPTAGGRGTAVVGRACCHMSWPR